MPTRIYVVVVSSKLSVHPLISQALDHFRYEIAAVSPDDAVPSLEARPADIIVVEMHTLAETLALIDALRVVCAVPSIALVPSPTPTDYDVVALNALPPQTRELFPPIDPLSLHIVVSHARELAKHARAG